MKRFSLFPAVLLLLLVLAVVAVVPGCKEEAPPVSGNPTGNNPTPPEPPAPPENLSPITGKPLVSPGSPVAVSIDNYPNARPQTGLNGADVIYEVLAEGGITRYLAIFHSQSPETVGPVRSARPYFALLAKEWGAVFGHCGGDPKDIQPIRDWSVVDGDEFRYGHLYWRDKSRSAPHNLYTSVENLRKVPSEPLPAPSERWAFGEWSPSPEAGLNIRYNKNYAVQYRYESEGYTRYILENSAEPSLHVDRMTEAPVEASNIIVQFAPSEVIYSDGGLVIDLVGTGKAAYMLGGVYSEGTWEKTGVYEPTLFLSADGKKIAVVPGQTWIQIVPEDAKVERVQAK